MNKKLLLYIGISAFLIAFSSCNKDELEDLNTKVSDIENNTQTDDKALKMESMASLFDAMARQPEASADLVSATAILYNDYTELLPLTDKAVMQRGLARGTALGAMFAAIARQPEMAEQIDAAADRFLGAYSPEYINDELLSYSKSIAVQSLLEAIARQPEATPTFNTLSKKYLNYEFLTVE